MLKDILLICDFVAAIFILSYCIRIIGSIFNWAAHHEKPALSNFSPFKIFGDLKDEDHKINWIAVIALTLSVVGIGDTICRYSFASEEIGAFYEKSEYTTDYEALLYIGDKETNDDPIFCIATVSKRGKDDYEIVEVQMPLNYREYDDAAYDPESNIATVCLGENDIECDLSLKAPATRESRILLKNETISSNGIFCGSRNSKVYHYECCKNAQNIKHDNLVRFDSPKEAFVCGYRLCEYCEETYGDPYWY